MALNFDLYDEFLKKWPLDTVRGMRLEEYTQAKRRTGGTIDTFTYWLESKLEDYGSIWGGSAFKFGIFSRNDESEKTSKSGRSYSSNYAWYTKYGADEKSAFTRVRALVVAVIEAVRRNDLAAIDDIDLGDVYKWKIAFHYQNDIRKPVVIDMYDPVVLRAISGLGKKAPLSECQTKILSARGAKDVLEYSVELWNVYQKRNAAEIVDTSENRVENLNTILYGPPGTGKTYKVLQIVRQLEERAEIAAADSKITWLDPKANWWHLAPGEGGYLWDTLKTGNRLGYEWCSNDYGDLKKEKIENEHWSIIKRFSKVKKGDYFAVISGLRVFAVARAKHDYDYTKAVTDDLDFQTVEIEWIAQFELPINLNSTQTMTFCNMKSGSRWGLLVAGLAENGYIVGEKTATDSEKKPERHGRKSHLFVTFHQSYGYEDFVQGIKPVMSDDTGENDGSLSYRVEPGIFMRACEYACQNAGYAGLAESLEDDRNERKRRFAEASPFYLVIDEINRGNIANIFGELITLIETDKRLGNENETVVTLPYSKLPFGVPGNLYIVGTMNTADRSVEALDAALRRRFSFVEAYPNSEIIAQPEEFAVDLQRLLDAINERLTITLDRDHTIGHAYFTGIKDSADPLEALAETFRRKIIPQLQEYFYGAPKRLRAILGEKFVVKKECSHNLFGDTGQPDDGDPFVWIMCVPPTNTDEERTAAEKAFIGLYE